jgi:hypothetical protein
VSSNASLIPASSGYKQHACKLRVTRKAYYLPGSGDSATSSDALSIKSRSLSSCRPVTTTVKMTKFEICRPQIPQIPQTKPQIPQIPQTKPQISTDSHRFPQIPQNTTDATRNPRSPVQTRLPGESSSGASQAETNCWEVLSWQPSPGEGRLGSRWGASPRGCMPADEGKLGPHFGVDR